MTTVTGCLRTIQLRIDCDFGPVGFSAGLTCGASEQRKNLPVSAHHWNEIEIEHNDISTVFKSDESLRTQGRNKFEPVTYSC